MGKVVDSMKHIEVMHDFSRRIASARTCRQADALGEALSYKTFKRLKATTEEDLFERLVFKHLEDHISDRNFYSRLAGYDKHASRGLDDFRRIIKEACRKHIYNNPVTLWDRIVGRKTKELYLSSLKHIIKQLNAPTFQIRPPKKP